MFTGFPNPEPNCSLCPRLADFLSDTRKQFPDWHNKPVPTWGDPSAQLLIVGLAPGLRGANRTGRPFTGDYAGSLLYETLATYGFADGTFDARADDGLSLVNTAVTNAVRCVPPQNKPIGAEINTCRQFLSATFSTLSNISAVVTLGRIAHESTLRALGEKPSRFKFAHGAQHQVGSVVLFNSYHCSRYNTNTGRLTEEMFRSVFLDVQAYLEKQDSTALAQ